MSQQSTGLSNRSQEFESSIKQPSVAVIVANSVTKEVKEDSDHLLASREDLAGSDGPLDLQHPVFLADLGH